MENMYDNGEQFIGECRKLRDYNDRLYAEKVIDKETYDEWENELKELEDDTIVMIDYSFTMGIFLRTFEKSDIVKDNIE